jgi:nucleotide-binding universal stress UspA family protein
MATWTIIKLAVGGAIILALMGWGGKIVYNHDQKVKAAMQAEIDSLKSKQTVLESNQQETKKIVDNLAKIKRRASGEKSTMQQAIVEPTPDNYVNFTRRYRVRPGDQAGPPPNGKGAGHPPGKTRPQALPAPN